MQIQSFWRYGLPESPSFQLGFVIQARVADSLKLRLLSGNDLKSKVLSSWKCPRFQKREQSKLCVEEYPQHLGGCIRKCTWWRVGNGKRIHIWEDRWLPTPSTQKVISPQKPFDNFPMVSSLIDEDIKW